MDRDELKARILKIRGFNVADFNETQAKKAIIEPILDRLDWDTEDPSEVILEYNMTSGGRVDYALLNQAEPSILLEAKPPHESLDKHGEQLLRYAFDRGVELAALSNGLEWWLYLPMEKGPWESRKFYSIDLAAQDIEDVCDRLIEFLSKGNVTSGRALESAKKMRRSRERTARIKETLPEVWRTMIKQPNEILVDLLIEETERKCGFKPDAPQVKSFLEDHLSPSVQPVRLSVTRSATTASQHQRTARSQPGQYRNKKVYRFTFLGSTVPVHNWFEVLTKVCGILAEKHPTTYESILLGFQGHRRVYFSRNKHENSFPQPQPIPNTKLYAMTKLSADMMVNQCRRVIELFGHEPSALQIDYT